MNNQINNYINDKRILYLIKGNFYYVSAFIVLQGLNKIFIYPFLSHSLGESLFGNFILAMTIANILVTAGPGNVATVLIREHSKIKTVEKDLFFRTAYYLTLIICIIFAIGYLVSIPWLKKIFHTNDIGIFIAFLAIYVVFLSLRGIGIAFLRIDLKFKQISIHDIFLGFCYLLVIPLFFLFQSKGIGLGYALASFISLFLVLYSCKNNIQLKYPILKKKYVLKIVKIGLYWSVASFFALLMQSIDRGFIGYYIDTANVTYYFAAASIAVLITSPVGIFSSILFPVISQKKNINDFNKNDLIHYTASMLFACCVIFLIGLIAGTWIIRLAYGNVILKACKNCFYILLIGNSIFCLQAFTRSFIDTFLNPSISLYTAIFSIIVNVILNYLWIPKYGIIGAAFATSISIGSNGLVWFSIYLIAFIIRGKYSKWI